MKIHLPNSAHLQNIEGFLRTVDPQDTSSLAFSMNPKWVSVHPMALALAACAGAMVKQNGGTFTGKVEATPSAKYLVRMGLFNFIDIPHPQIQQEHEAAGRFIPLTQILTKEDLSKFIADMIPLLHAAPEVVDPIKFVISELVRNVLEHSASPVGALICAQYYKATKRLSVGVADAGIGIHEAMSEFHHPLTSKEAVLLALRPGVTGTTARLGGTAYNAGAGLFFTKSIAYASRNHFSAFTGDYLFKLRKTPEREDITINADPREDYSTQAENFPSWRGTAMGIDISEHSSGAFSALLDEIRGAYRLDLKSKKTAKYKKPKFI